MKLLALELPVQSRYYQTVRRKSDTEGRVGAALLCGQFQVLRMV